MAQSTVITGTGVYIPPDKISNEELVNSYNAYVDHYHQQHQAAIESGQMAKLEYSSASFIEKASGIKNRSVIDKKGILDIHRMRPYIAPRDEEAVSLQCEIACKAIHQALDYAQKTPQEIDGLIVSCVSLQRAYPSIAIEIQQQMGFSGFAFDMVAGCSSSTFGLANGINMVQQNQARCMVVVNPEISSAQVNFRDRDSHFIFSDACTATVIEQPQQATIPGFEILGYKLHTAFSNNIRNQTGFLNVIETATGESTPCHFFKQNGRKVFKDVVPMVETHLLNHLKEMQLVPKDIKRFWLHQANINMNELIIKKLLGVDATFLDAPIILDKFGNTTSCGSLIAFHYHHDDLKSGDLGVICSFGAGYSIGSILVRKQ